MMEPPGGTALPPQRSSVLANVPKAAVLACTTSKTSLTETSKTIKTARKSSNGKTTTTTTQLITAILSERLGVPCVIDNDAVTAAIGEHAYGAGRDSSGLLVVTLGTGVGVAALIRGRPVRGADGGHPEAGHIAVSGPPAPCYCGLPT